MTNDAKHIGSVLEALERAAQDEGHVFLFRRELEARLCTLGMDLLTVEEAITTAARDGFITVRGRRIYLPHLDQAEQRLADGVRAMMRRG
jgi:hypothetical protein